MSPTRRDFLKTSGLVAWGLSVPTFLTRTARAAPDLGQPAPKANAPALHVSYSSEISPLALAGAPVRVPSIASLEEFQLKFAAANSADKQQQRAIVETATAPTAPGGPGLLDFVQRTAVNTYAS